MFYVDLLLFHSWGGNAARIIASPSSVKVWVTLLSLENRNIVNDPVVLPLIISSLFSKLLTSKSFF